MRVLTRELLIRLLGVILGVWFVIGSAHDIRAGQYNWHGDVLQRADHPTLFWTGVAFEAFCGLIGLMMAVFGAGSNWKR
jgi:hypothetical protein